MRHAILSLLLLMCFSVWAVDDSTSSLATTLKQRDQEAQRKENAEKTTRKLILSAKERLEREYIAASWDIFNELKQQGVRFRTDLTLPSNPMCSSTILDKRSDGEFIVFGAHCDGVYVNFWPAGATENVVLNATLVYGNRNIDDIKFDNTCIILLHLFEYKKYTCPDLLKPEASSIIWRDVRELITKQLSQ
jgi:hypothetical protein